MKKNTIYLDSLNTMKKTTYIIILFLSFAYGCKDKIDEEPLSDAKQLLSFKLEAAFNNALNGKDIEGEVKNDAVYITVPEGMNLSGTVPTFTFEGQSVYVGNTKQVSRETANDFSSTIVYKVVAEDQSTRQYSVHVNRVKLSDKKQLGSFKFESELNPDLGGKGIEGEIADNSILLKIPEGFSLSKLVATFTYEGEKVLVGSLAQVSGETPNNFTGQIAYTVVAEDGSRQQYPVVVERFAPIPHFYIDTEGNSPIDSKENYLNATIRVEANGWGEDYQGAELKDRIRGRGNSTWGLPKKPYRLKLNKKASILGLATEKDWVLLANYLDPTLLLNATAFKIGQLLDLKYTNHSVPVDLTVNGEYMGSYQLTEQVEISESRVNISDKTGVLLELDTNYDEDYKFYSPNFSLPVMVKDPDIESSAQFQKIKSDFIAFENAVAAAEFPNNNWKDFIDVQSLVKYLIVYNFTHNMEINHPKSTYMYKDGDGKYFMGPIWDFDWAYDYEGKNVHFSSYSTPLFRQLSSGDSGYKLFPRFMQDAQVMELYKQTWQDFKANKFNALIEYINDYAYLLTGSKKKDHQKWNRGSAVIQTESNKLKNWLNGRAGYLDNYVKTLK